MSKVYLDYAAATPLSTKAMAAMQPFFQEQFYNPSGLSMFSREAQQQLKSFRSGVAGTLNTHHSNVLFTAGATEANNLILHGVAARNPGCHMLVSAVEHDAVLKLMPWLEKWFGVSWSSIPVDSNGIVSISSVMDMLQSDTKLISIIHANNETGVVQPIADLKKSLWKADTAVRVHSDMSQSPLVYRMHFDRLGADAITLNGGKMYGPKQSGLVVSSFLHELDPLMVGGGQEKGLRSGTESLAQIAGFSTALIDAQSQAHQEYKRLKSLQEDFESSLLLLGGEINGYNSTRSPAITSVRFKGADAERLVIELEQQGVVAAVGSACSAMDVAGSHVLSAMGLSEQEVRSTLRFSFGESTTPEKLKKTIKVLTRLLSEIS